jgi:SWI/SNF-related matrix-associated actin-dependent regulator 1 of chromatin subfamily A
MNKIESFLQEMETDYIRIDGNTSLASRNSKIEDFQQNDLADVAILSLNACGMGLTLTKANVAIFAELAWSPATIIQAEDRIHRIGQTSLSVRLVYAIADNTADGIVWEQLQRKFGIVGTTVGNF